MPQLEAFFCGKAAQLEKKCGTLGIFYHGQVFLRYRKNITFTKTFHELCAQEDRVYIATINGLHLPDLK